MQSLTFHNLHPISVKYHLERCLANLLALKVLIHPFHKSILFAKRFVAFKKVKVSTVNLMRPPHFFSNHACRSGVEFSFRRFQSCFNMFRDAKVLQFWANSGSCSPNAVNRVYGGKILLPSLFFNIHLSKCQQKQAFSLSFPFANLRKMALTHPFMEIGPKMATLQEKKTRNGP